MNDPNMVSLAPNVASLLGGVPESGNRLADRAQGVMFDLPFGPMLSFRARYIAIVRPIVWRELG